jgi:uncharacterized protein (TIGR03437 family)
LEGTLVKNTLCKIGARAAFLLCTTVIGLPAQNLTTIASFNSTYSGGGPAAALVQGSDGSFYGTTPGGGTSNKGTIFKVAPNGTFTTLYSFCSVTNCADGSQPMGSLIQASDGNLYGTTSSGGANNFQGTVFKITPGGTLKTLFSFAQDASGRFSSGTDPEAGLIQASDGNLYGTTSASGAHMDGTVFKITPGGTLTTLYSFCSLAGCADGSQPADALTQGSDGNFYGTTTHGGTNTENNDGMVFKLTPGGALTTLYSFCSRSDCADGLSPTAGLIQASDGNFYGTSAGGGPGGSIFKITPGGTLTNLYSFCSQPNCVDGKTPRAGIIQAADGNLYGTTSVGGANSSANVGEGGGTVFKITLGGALTTVYSFCSQNNCADGAGPVAGVIQAADGSFIGATVHGGPHGDGAVFKLTLGSSQAAPPAISQSGGVLNGASFQPGIAPNSWMTISGTNLASKIDTWANEIVNGKLPTSLDGVSVTVGGDPAYVYYISPTQINAVAPNLEAGAAQVIVTNSSGVSSPANTVVQTARPAFFQWGNYAVATRQDYSLAVKSGTFPGATTTPAKPGDVIILWGTGFGPTSPAAPVGAEVPSTTTYNTANTVSVTVGGKTATVYGAALAPGYAGLFQVAIQIPASLSNGDYPVIATVSGAQSPSATLITVQN